MSKTRNSSVELLKIIAIVIIIISHSVPFGSFSNYHAYINLNLSSTNIQKLILTMFRYLGSIGNCIFIICSSYYLLESKRIKIGKIINLIINATVISSIIMIFYRYVLNIDNIFSSKELIKMVLPVLFSSYWFITVYICVYAITPLLNNAISLLTKKQHLIYTIVFIILLSINTLTGSTLYFNELIGFISIYFILSYLKKYHNDFENNNKMNITLYISSLLILLISIILLNYLGINIKQLNGNMLLLNKFYNPLIIIHVLSLFYLFKSKSFNNRLINKVSGLSLLIYLFHGQQFVVGYTKGLYHDALQLNNNYDAIIASLVLAVLFFVGSLFLSLLYNYIENKVKIIFKK